MWSCSPSECLLSGSGIFTPVSGLDLTLRYLIRLVPSFVTRNVKSSSPGSISGMTSTSDHSSTSRGSDARTSHSHRRRPRPREAKATLEARQSDGHAVPVIIRVRAVSDVDVRVTYSAQHGNSSSARLENAERAFERVRVGMFPACMGGRRMPTARRRSNTGHGTKRRAAQITARKRRTNARRGSQNSRIVDAAGTSEAFRRARSHQSVTREPFTPESLRPSARNPRPASHRRGLVRRRHHKPGQDKYNAEAAHENEGSYSTGNTSRYMNRANTHLN